MVDAKFFVSNIALTFLPFFLAGVNFLIGILGIAKLVSPRPGRQPMDASGRDGWIGVTERPPELPKVPPRGPSHKKKTSPFKESLLSSNNYAFNIASLRL